MCRLVAGSSEAWQRDPSDSAPAVQAQISLTQQEKTSCVVFGKYSKDFVRAKVLIDCLLTFSDLTITPTRLAIMARLNFEPVGKGPEALFGVVQTYFYWSGPSFRTSGRLNRSPDRLPFDIQ